MSKAATIKMDSFEVIKEPPKQEITNLNIVVVGDCIRFSSYNNFSEDRFAFEISFSQAKILRDAIQERIGEISENRLNRNGGDY